MLALRSLFLWLIFPAVGSAATITVTSTSDSGAGSLRNAISTANGTSAVDTIQFNIPGACPQVILLSSPLPHISTGLVIDGYSQPGSAANSTPVGSNASLCVLVAAQSGTLDHAISVGGGDSVAVTIKGLGFGSAFLTGALTRGILVLGGSNHILQGNQFAGDGPVGLGNLGFITIGVEVGNATGTLLIGGNSPAHRNVFAGTTSQGIYIAGDPTVTIENNYFGLSATGTVVQGLQFAAGIQINDAANTTISNNVFAGLSGGVQLVGSETSGTKIQNNLFGVNAGGFYAPAYANNIAIQIAQGAHNNQIGTLVGSTLSNRISNSTLAGVLLDLSAGTGNLINLNAAYGNGSSGIGLGIDIMPIGQNPNDPLDADGGPNDGQNWPEVAESLFNPGTGMRILSGRIASTPGRNFRLDFYRATGCLSGNRAEALTFLGSTVVATASGGLNNGFGFYSVALPNTGAPAFVTATATDTTTLSTSELAPCLAEPIFKDGFDGVPE